MVEQRWETKPHRRYNLLTGEWVLVSPHRTSRPWDGQQEEPERLEVPAHDPECYLCPGNTRAGNVVNPNYSDTFVFTNDFAALLPDTGEDSAILPEDDLLRAEPETGTCRVVCYDPRHDLTMARLQADRIEQVISAWQQEYLDLGGQAGIKHVQIFENRGLMMGCSNPHPHGQIWATGSIPTLVARELFQQYQYVRKNGSCLLCDYLEREIREQERILFENDSFVALVPFWAVWPFETMVLPKQHGSSITSLAGREKRDLAEMMQAVAVCYDNLFETSFPYSMGIHQQPTDGGDHDYCHYHIHYLPPLLRSKTVKKHMVGFELLAMPQRDLTPESAVSTMREMAKVHYLERGKA